MSGIVERAEIGPPPAIAYKITTGEVAEIVAFALVAYPPKVADTGDQSIEITEITKARKPITSATAPYGTCVHLIARDIVRH